MSRNTAWQVSNDRSAHILVQLAWLRGGDDRGARDSRSNLLGVARDMTQLRLIIAAVILLALASTTAVAMFYRGEAISAAADAAQARIDLTAAKDANDTAAKTISALQEQSRLDSRLTASLVEEMRKISDGLAEQSQQIDELEKSNADVRAYLDGVVPADLRKLRQR